MNVLDKGAEITLVSKSIDPMTSQQDSTGVATSTITARFTIRVKAVDGDVLLGSVASGTPAFASSTTGFKVYVNGAYNATISSNATTTSYSNPSGYTITTDTFTISDTNSVDIPITYTLVGRTATGARLAALGSSIAIQVAGIQWAGPGGAKTTTFMDAKSDWRTTDITMN